MYFSRVRMGRNINEYSELAGIIKNNSHGVHSLLWKLFPDQVERTFLYREEIAREQLGMMQQARGEPVYYLVSKTKPVEPENSLLQVEIKGYKPKLEAGQRLIYECRVNPVITKNGKKHDVVMNTQIEFLKELISQFSLQEGLTSPAKKHDYKQMLLKKADAKIKQHLEGILANDARYAERLHQVSSFSDTLEWAIKSRVDNSLENWWKRQGERCGFNLDVDGAGLTKFQNSAYQWHALPEKDKNPMKNSKVGFSSVDFTGELTVTDIDHFKTALFNGIGRSKAFGCGMLLIRRYK